MTIGPAEIKKFNLMNSFGSKWEEKEVDAAVLPDITSLNSEELNQSINKVLQCITDKKTELMERDKDLTQLNSKQLYLTRVEVRHSSQVFHHHITPATFHNKLLSHF